MTSSEPRIVDHAAAGESLSAESLSAESLSAESLSDEASADETPAADVTPSTEPPLARGLEALLFLADEPLDIENLAVVLEAEPEVVEEALIDLARRSIVEERGTEVRATAGGWRMYTAPAARPVIERWALAGRTGRLTQAALETLAVVAYKQPISRQEIGEIRGVNADGAVRSLVARGFIGEVGRDPGPGQAALFGTTRLLLERLGLDSLEALPPLTDFLPEAPAPDEPELGALKEIRRRLAAGGDLTARGLGGRSAAQTNTGGAEDAGDDVAGDEDDDVLPPPVATVGGPRDDDQMDELTDRLEQAARNAVGRLRAAVAAGDGRPRDDDDAATSEAPDATSEAPDGDGGSGTPTTPTTPTAPTTTDDEQRDDTDG